jgi:ABC-2 type transport system permease protein
VIAALVLGVVVITGEYATGLVRTSLTAVPNRTAFLVGKAACLAGIVLIASLIAMFTSFFTGQGILSAKSLDVGLGAPHVLRAVVGGALYLTAASLFAYAIGVLLRHTGGAVASAIGAIFVLPIVIGFLPSSWHASKYTPSGAGMAIMSTIKDKTQFAPWTGFALFLVYVVVLLGLALWLFRERDA